MTNNQTYTEGNIYTLIEKRPLSFYLAHRILNLFQCNGRLSQYLSSTQGEISFVEVSFSIDGDDFVFHIDGAWSMSELKTLYLAFVGSDQFDNHYRKPDSYVNAVYSDIESI